MDEPFKINNIFLKSLSKEEKPTTEGFIEGEFYNSRVHVYGDTIRLMESFMPVNEFLASKIILGKNETTLISISHRNKEEVNDGVVVLFKEQEVFGRKAEPKLRIGNGRLR